MIAFITGGVRSGKSSYAEQLAISLVNKNSRPIYIATSRIEDAEMDKRVIRHQKDRDRSGVEWVTIEQPRFLESLLPIFQKGDVLLLDCLTNLVSNELFFDWDKATPSWHKSQFRKQVKKRIISFVERAKEKELTLIIVSNELFYSPIPNDQGTYYYMQMLGTIHQELIEIVDQALLIEFGYPFVMKKEGE